MYSIVLSPDEKLRQPTGPVDFSGPRLTKIISEMKQILISQKDPEGVGLAANQIGLPYSLFLARFDTKPNEPIHVFINPEMIAHSGDFQPENEEKAPLEGCLSLPNYYGTVKRWKSVTIKYSSVPNIPNSPNLPNNLMGNAETFTGFPATVIQHEMDHLHGKIFVEKILEQQGKLYRSTGKTKKGKDIWEEVEL